MASLGEVDFLVTSDNIQLRIRALVMKRLQAECFGGMTFHADNGIEANIKSGTISIHGKYVVKQFNPLLEVKLHPPDKQVLTSPSDCLNDQPANDSQSSSSSSSHAQGNQLGPPVPLCYAAPDSHPPVIRTISLPTESMVLPSDYLQIPIPPDVTASYLSITPSFQAAIDCPSWPPQICEVVNGSALYQNNSGKPIVAPKFSHFKPNPVDISELTDHSTQEELNFTRVPTVHSYSRSQHLS